MFFPPNAPIDVINRYCQQQISAIDKNNGTDVIIKPHTKQRTVRQNRYLMEVCANIVRFYQDTGYIPPHCPKWCMKTTLQKEYWKDVFGILETHKLSTKDMAQFIDNIQNSMIQNTQGEYQPIIPDDDYLISLENIP